MVILRMRDLLILAQVYGRHTGMNLSAVGRLVARNQEMFDRISKGGGCNARATEGATGWFVENWPDQIPWPAEVPDLRHHRIPRVKTPEVLVA